MLLMIEKVEDYDKNKESSTYALDMNNLYGWVMSQKLPVDAFEWIENTFQCN